MNKHVVITRLNNEHRDGRWHDSEWIQYRLDLMRVTAARSISRQTFRDFDWVILIDPRTEHIVSDWSKSSQDLGAIFCTDYSAYRYDVMFKHKPEYIYEARIDCDDIMDDRVLEKFFTQPAGEVEAVWLRDGYIFNAITGEIAYSVFANGASSAFVSYIYPAKDWAMNREDWLLERGGSDHTQASRFAKSVRIDEVPYMIVYHGGNVTDQWTNHAGEPLDEKEELTLYKHYGLSAVLDVVSGTN